MPWMSLIAPVVGGLLGGQGNSQTQTTQNKVDPRFAEYMYGAGGLLPAAQDWYSQNKSGMNPQMLTGMNNQWNALSNSGPGYQQMQNLGLGLMGGGSAGNPFTMGSNAGGGAPGSGAAGNGAMTQGQSYQPAPMMTGGQFQMPTAPQQRAPVQQTAPQAPDWAQMMYDRGGMR